jgi:2-keto-4-pentenoate hydratase
MLTLGPVLENARFASTLNHQLATIANNASPAVIAIGQRRRMRRRVNMLRFRTQLRIHGSPDSMSVQRCVVPHACAARERELPRKC